MSNSQKPRPDVIPPGRVSEYLRSQEYNYSSAMVVHEHLNRLEDRLCVMQACLYGTLVMLLEALVKEGIPLESILENYLKTELRSEDTDYAMVTLSRFLVFSGLETETATNRVNHHVARLKEQKAML